MTGFNERSVYDSGSVRGDMDADGEPPGSPPKPPVSELTVSHPPYVAVAHNRLVRIEKRWGGVDYITIREAREYALGLWAAADLAELGPEAAA